LNNILEEMQHSSAANDDIDIPLKSDGSKYKLEDLKDDQRRVVAYVIERLEAWLRYATMDDSDEIPHFEPIRLTVVGAGGTGKSVIINTLLTVIREMFQVNNSALVGAPTGTAAFNVCGETLHRMLSILVGSIYDADSEMGTHTKMRLVKKLIKTVAIFIDERSMVSLSTMGTAERHARETAHGGIHAEEDWGGIPIVIIFGDDCQLPPCMAKGVFDIPALGSNASLSLNQAEAAGVEHFLRFAEDVMYLKKNKRANDDQAELLNLNEKARLGKLDLDTSEKLMSELNLHKNKFYTENEKQAIFEKSLFLSANKEPVQAYNIRRLKEKMSKENPVAVIKSRTDTSQKKRKGNHFNRDSSPPRTCICSGSRVSIIGRNFYPAWGLHVGAIGIVVEIVFRENESPNSGDLPAYVVVDFPAYRGPAWDTKNPKVRTNSSPQYLLTSTFCFLIFLSTHL
jgi:hypothetical protein